MNTNTGWNENIPRFETDIEKAMHKIVSSLRYSEEIKLSTESLNVDEEKAMVKALKKSAKFNCISLRILKQRDQPAIKISANVIQKDKTMDVNSDEVIYTMMITSLEDKIKSIRTVMETQTNLISKIMTQYQNNTNELIKYKEKYGEL